MRTTKVALVLALTVLGAEKAHALEVPRFSKGGMLLALEFGPGAWDFDQSYLASQIAQNPGYGPSAGAIAAGWTGSFKTSYCLSLRIGYNIMGFATVELSFTGTGWDLGSEARGGGGFAGGVVRFHPLEILWRVLKKDPRPFGLDVTTYWGWGYGIAGFGANTLSLAMGTDGFAFQWGFDAEYFFTKSIGLSLGLRGAFPFWEHLYFNFGEKQGPSLPQTSKGAFWTPALGVLMRFGD